MIGEDVIKQEKPTARPLVCVAAAVAAAVSGATANAQDVQFEFEEHAIDEIIVEGAALDRTIRGLAQPTDILGGDELRRKQAASLGETLSDELGVSSSYFGPVASRPIVRGQSGERVKVLTNGLDSIDASALSEDHAPGINSLLAERVEIVRGPATLLYGSGAAGGMINVIDNRIQHHALDKPFGGAVELGTDSATGRTTGAAAVRFGTDSVIAQFDYSRIDTDNVSIPGYAESALLRALEEEEHEDEDHEDEEEAYGTVENTDSETENAGAAVTFVGQRGFIGVSFSSNDSVYGIPGHGHHEEEHGEDEEDEEEHGEENVRIDLEQQRFDLRGQLDIGDTAGLEVRVGRSDYEHVELEGDEVGTIFAVEGIDSRIEYKHGVIGPFEGAVGVQYRDVDFDAVGPEAYVPQSNTSQTSLFAFEEWTLNDAWVLQGSARFERQTIDSPGLTSYSDNAFGMSVGAIWNSSENTSLSLNYALTERHPNATELYADGEHVAVNRIERGSVTLGNGILDTEKSSNLDVSLHGDHDRIEWTVTAFINDIDDYILLAPTDEFDDELRVFEYMQTDARLTGFEAEARVELMEAGNGHLHSRVFADAVRGEDSRTGFDLPQIPPTRYGIGLHYTRDRFEAGVEYRYHDKQDRIAPNELPTDSYGLVNAELSYVFEGPELFLFARGTNLTDEDARRHSSPLKDTFPLPGRSLQLGVRYDF